MSTEIGALTALQPRHFAFMRAVVQGVDPADSWRRYLQADQSVPDLREISRTVSWIKDAFARAARQHQRHGLARLVGLDLAARARAADRLPDLAEFVKLQDLEGFSEAEQLDMYRGHYSASVRRRSRDVRLIARQLDALHWLQQIAPQPPAGHDALAYWLAPRLAAHLAQANLASVQALTDYVQHHGPRWWRFIPSIGAVKAARIRATLDGYLTLAPAQDGAKVMPLPQLAAQGVPEARQGRLRAPPADCRCGAETDLEALRTWLHAKGSPRSPADALPPMRALTTPGWEILKTLNSTQRAYWKEAERFVLWLAIERRSCLSDAAARDCSAYLEFLTAPPAHWCAPRDREKASGRWRPFEGPLSPAACKFAYTVLNGLYRFLVCQRYLAANPFEGIWTAKRGNRRPDGVARAAGHPGIDAMLASQLQALPPTGANARLRFAIQLIRETGMRIGEAVRATTDDLLPPATSSDPWQLRVRATAGPGRTVTLSADLTAALGVYLFSRDIRTSLQDLRNAGIHLLGRAADAGQRAPWAPCAREPIDRKAGIGAGTLRDQFRGFFRTCAVACGARPALAAQLATADSRWLRALPAVSSAPRRLRNAQEMV